MEFLKLWTREQDGADGDLIASWISVNSTALSGIKAAVLMMISAISRGYRAQFLNGPALQFIKLRALALRLHPVAGGGAGLRSGDVFGHRLDERVLLAALLDLQQGLAA